MIFRRIYISSLAILACGACSGDGGGGSSATPTAGTPSPTASASPTTADLIAAAESRGELPRLDRTTTLNGIDADSNGVRDDLDAYVAALPASTAQKASLLQQARATQRTINAPTGDRAAMDAARLAEARAVHCVYSRYPTTDATAAGTISQTMETLSLNTDLRIKAYIAYGAASDGTVLPSPEGDTCD